MRSGKCQTTRRSGTRPCETSSWSVYVCVRHRDLTPGWLLQVYADAATDQSVVFEILVGPDRFHKSNLGKCHRGARR